MHSMSAMNDALQNQNGRSWGEKLRPSSAAWVFDASPLWRNVTATNDK